MIHQESSSSRGAKSVVSWKDQFFSQQQLFDSNFWVGAPGKELYCFTPPKEYPSPAPQSLHNPKIWVIPTATLSPLSQGCGSFVVIWVETGTRLQEDSPRAVKSKDKHSYVSGIALISARFDLVPGRLSFWSHQLRTRTYDDWRALDSPFHPSRQPNFSSRITS